MAGVYISYPFCAQKCTYCNFASGVFPRELEPRYLRALESEIASHRWQWTPDTVYLGGGTPSQMSVEALTHLLTMVERGAGTPACRVETRLDAPYAPSRPAPWREATIEVAPGSITAEKCRAWTAAGINRVSLGVQSFVQRELSRTGRKHDADVVAREIEILRSNNIAKRITDNHRVPFTYDDDVVKLIVSRCTELESGGRMIDSILTNTMLPRVSHEILTRMMTGGAIARVGVTVSGGDFAYAFE